MKALFLGHFAATVAPRILAKVRTPLETSILDDEGDAAQLAPLLADAEIVVGHIWRAGFPPAPRLRLLQSVSGRASTSSTPKAVPKRVTICNVFGHEPAIAEYVIMTMLILTHRLFEAVTAFRAGSWVASPQFGGGGPHGEVLGRTIGIIGYGRIGRDVAERAAGPKCRVLAANRSPVADPAPAETVFPLAEVDRMLPLCDTVLIACALAPETAGLIDARRLALMKPGALLNNPSSSGCLPEAPAVPARLERARPATIGNLAAPLKENASAHLYH
jgi:phosphoglycerate dehydrogenase-like enzyme